MITAERIVPVPICRAFSWLGRLGRGIDEPPAACLLPGSAASPVMYPRSRVCTAFPALRTNMPARAHQSAARFPMVWGMFLRWR